MIKIDQDILSELIRSAVSCGVREGVRLALNDVDLPVPPSTGKLLRPLMTMQEVSEYVSRSRSSIYRDVKRGTFPAPLKTGSKSNAWIRAEVEDWIQGLPRRKHFG